MTATEVERLETGWFEDTPTADNLLRRFAQNQAALLDAIAAAAGGRIGEVVGARMADSAGPVPYWNQALLTRPLRSADDVVLDEIDEFFAPTRATHTVLSLWPTPSLTPRGWTLVGHPAFVVRAPGLGIGERRAGVSVDVVTTAEDLALADRIAVEGYPLPEAAGAIGSCLPPRLVDSDVIARVGRHAGEPVAVGVSHVSHGLANLCLGATLPAARRHGVWEALVWARLADAPELPAAAFTSDDSRPGFERMGFLTITRFTLWARS